MEGKTTVQYPDDVPEEGECKEDHTPMDPNAIILAYLREKYQATITDRFVFGRNFVPYP